MNIVYSIEGNIGSGKSTLLQLLRAHIPGMVVSP
jgi:deoxyadenosine/deoxycytidine kinase